MPVRCRFSVSRGLLLSVPYRSFRFWIFLLAIHPAVAPTARLTTTAASDTQKAPTWYHSPAALATSLLLPALNTEVSPAICVRHRLLIGLLCGLHRVSKVGQR